MSLIEIFGQYKDDYINICFINENNNSYYAHNIKTNQDCVLKIINKKQLELGDYDFLIEQIRLEEEITKACNSENTVNFYRKLETDNYIIFELEYCETDLKYYLVNNGELREEKELFKEIVIGISKALKTLQKKGVMHRDIRPDNIFIKSMDDASNIIIKLGNFNCSIYIKDNTSEPLGTIFYSSPEIIKNIEYDEKCDLWNLGVTLFELYFGVLPYGINANTNIINSIIYGEEEFIIKQSKIPTLDTLFKKLLTIEQKDRMKYDEFFNYVLNDDFMKEGIIAINDNLEYRKLYDNIINGPEPTINYNDYKYFCSEEKENMYNILNIVEGGHLPDVMNFPNRMTNELQIFNNIIYYDENTDYMNDIKKDSDYFERVTPGAFILCTSIDSLKLIREEILKQIKKDKMTTFNLITTGSKCEKILEFLKENKDNENYVKNICVYCKNLKKWLPLKKKYKIIYDVCDTRKGVFNFINKFASNKIKPFPLSKLITFQDYLYKNKERHFNLSQFYGDLTIEKYKKYLESNKELIKNEGSEKDIKNKDEYYLLSDVLTFNLSRDLSLLNKLLKEEYIKNTFYEDLNKCLIYSKIISYEPIAYLTARLMYSLNKYATIETKYLTEEKELYRGVKLSYSNLLPYERAKGKIILLSAFIPTIEDKDLAKKWAGRQNTLSLYKTNLKFSVVFIIKNCNKKGWISNAIDLQQKNEHKKVKEFLFLPFSFYYVRDVQINLKNYTADIYLDTIGKMEILEEKIRIGKEIEFNQKEGIMQVK